MIGTGGCRSRLGLDDCKSIETNLRRAMIHGAVVASFCCEGFGLTHTTKAKKADINKRVRELEKLTKF